MNASQAQYALVLAALFAAGASNAVQAQTVTLLNGNGFTYNGLAYTISGCAYTALSVASTCAALNAELTTATVNGNLAVEVLGNGGGPVLSIAAGTTGKYSDLSFILTATAPSTRTHVTSVTDILSGTAASSDDLRVTSGVTPTVGATIQPGLTTNLSALKATESFAAFNPTALSPVSLNIDLKVNATTANVSGLVLTSAAFALTPAPEPGSIALFITGLGGLIAARRRHRKQV